MIVTVEDYKNTLQEQVKDMTTKHAYWHFWGLKTWMPIDDVSKEYIAAVNEMFEQYQDDMIDMEILESGI